MDAVSPLTYENGLLYRIRNTSDAFHPAFYHIPGLQKPGRVKAHADSGRSTHRYDGACPERHALRQFMDYISDIEDQQVCTAVLAQFFVYPGLNVQNRRERNAVCGQNAGPHGSETVQAFPEIPLFVTGLHIARAYIIYHSISENIRRRVFFRNMISIFADDDGKFCFIIQAVHQILMGENGFSVRHGPVYSFGEIDRIRPFTAESIIPVTGSFLCMRHIVDAKTDNILSRAGDRRQQADLLSGECAGYLIRSFSGGSGQQVSFFRQNLPDQLPEGVEGLHFHTLCEQDAAPLVETFAAFEKTFGQYLSCLKWINLGGGHHITRPGYDVAALERLILYIREKYHVTVYLEPGEAIALGAGTLITTVLDVVQATDMPVLILDTSAACHMPDVLEMPYRPPLFDSGLPGEKKVTCRLASRTCLAGDVIGEYSFDVLPQVGDRLVFGDMAIYSMVKNNTFNGMPLPDIALRHQDGSCEVVRRFGYQDFKMRLS